MKKSNLNEIKIKAFNQIIELLNKDNGKTFLNFNSILSILKNNDIDKTCKRSLEIKNKYQASESVLKAMKDKQKICQDILSIIDNSIKEYNK